MKLTGKTNNAIRKAVGCRAIELYPRADTHNAMRWREGDIAGDPDRLNAGLEVEDDDGLVELDLYLYHSRVGDMYGDFAGNRTVWVFEDGVGKQHVITRKDEVPNELERNIVRLAKRAWK